MNITTEINALKTSYAYSPEAVTAIGDATRIMSNYLEFTVEKSKKKATKSAALPSAVTAEVMRQIPEELSKAVLTQIKQLVHDLVELQLSSNPDNSADDLVNKSLIELSTKFPEVAALAQEEHNALLLSLFFHISAQLAQESIPGIIEEQSSKPLSAN